MPYDENVVKRELLEILNNIFYLYFYGRPPGLLEFAESGYHDIFT